MRHFTATSLLAFLTVALLSISANAQESDNVRHEKAERGAALFFDADAEDGAGPGEIDLEATLVGNTLYVTGKVTKLGSDVVENNTSKNGIHLFLGERGANHTEVFPLELQMTHDDTRGAIGGRIDLNDDQVRQLRNGEFSVDIHTEQHPDGEVHGALRPD